MNLRTRVWYAADMANRLPSKSLEGRRVRILISPNAKEGATGTVASVDETGGDVSVKLEGGDSTIVNWGRGDRWMVIPASVAATV